jgi:hypothetical protein
MRTSGRPRTKVSSGSRSCSMHNGPIVSVSQPGAVHCVTSTGGGARSQAALILRCLQSPDARPLGHHGPSVPGGVFDGPRDDRLHARALAGPRTATPDPQRLRRRHGLRQGASGSGRPLQWLARGGVRTFSPPRCPWWRVPGAQMLARAAGGTVGPASAAEIGWLGRPPPTGAADRYSASLHRRRPCSSGTTTPSSCRGQASSSHEARSARRRSAWPTLGDPVHAGSAGHGRHLGRGGPDDLPMPAEILLDESQARMTTSNSTVRRSPRRSSALLRRASCYSDTTRDHSCHEPT